MTDEAQEKVGLKPVKMRGEKNAGEKGERARVTLN